MVLLQSKHRWPQAAGPRLTCRWLSWDSVECSITGATQQPAGYSAHQGQPPRLLLCSLGSCSSDSWREWGWLWPHFALALWVLFSSWAWWLYIVQTALQKDASCAFCIESFSICICLSMLASECMLSLHIYFINQTLAVDYFCKLWVQ